jgi:hypothetical protein
MAYNFNASEVVGEIQDAYSVWFQLLSLVCCTINGTLHSTKNIYLLSKFRVFYTCFDTPLTGRFHSCPFCVNEEAINE